MKKEHTKKAREKYTLAQLALKFLSEKVRIQDHPRTASVLSEFINFVEKK